MKEDYSSFREQRDSLQKEISKTGNFLDASQNHYDILLERRDSLEAEIQTSSDTSLSKEYFLHEKRDDLDRVKDDLIDRHTQTEEGFEMYDSLRSELYAVDEQIEALRNNIAVGQKQKTHVKISIQRIKMFSKYHTKESDTFVNVYQDAALQVETMQKLGAPSSASELTVDRTYELSRDKSLQEDYRNTRWKNTPPPV
jgi:chromosome segregation ATPase